MRDALFRYNLPILILLRKFVQNQKIYIGNEYARDLTDKEIEEFEVYTKKQQEYEKNLQKILIDVGF